MTNHNVADQVQNGPHLAGYSISHNDHFHHLQINDRLVKLSPTEYRLCMCLLRHMEGLQQFALRPREYLAQEAPNVYVSFEDLQRYANLSTRVHVTRHVSNANGKLKIHGISIICVGECGYTLDFQRLSS